MHKKFYLIPFFVLVFFSCTTTQVEQTKRPDFPQKNLNIVICGDIMCHTQNFKTKDFNDIWKGIRDVTLNSDLTIANLEAPVCDDRPFENYPTFNMQSSYPQAAIDAGINVMTVANNHTNDQGEDGIISTAAWMKEIQEKYKDSKRPVYMNGLKTDVSTKQKASKSPVSYNYFTVKDYKVLFFGITQILNTQNYIERINYFPHTEKGKAALLEQVKLLREKNPCDVFILAIHADEPEYTLDIFKERRDFYLELLDAGVDVLWANHPHVPKPVEFIKNKDKKAPDKVILYSTGNTISGQRHKPNYENPRAIREYTGDGFLISLSIAKDKKGLSITGSYTDYITTFVDENRSFVIKIIGKDFYDYLDEKNLVNWKNYLIEREKALNEIKEITTCR